MNAQWLTEQFKKHPDKTRVGLAAKLDLDPPAISKILSGKRGIKADEYLGMRVYFGLSEVTDAGRTEGGCVLRAFSDDAGAWMIPERVLRGKTTAPPDQIRVFSVSDNAMAPDFGKGEQVLIDMTDAKPSPPGVFLVSDGMSYMVRACEYVPHSDPPKIKLNANNQKFSYVMELDKAEIIGRVIARMQWF